MDWKDKGFLKLRREWYKKLKDDGFVDIENVDWRDGTSGGEGRSRGLLNKGEGATFGSQADFMRKWTPAKEEYWRCLSKWSWFWRCADVKPNYGNKKRDRKILRMLCEGKGATQIAKELDISRRIIERVYERESKAMLAYIRAGGKLE